MKYFNLQNLILFIIVLAVLGIIAIIDWICSGLFDWYGHFLFIFIIIVLLKNITRLFVFPGSFWFWRRNMERIYSKRIASRLNNRVSDAIEILECLNQQSGQNIYFLKNQSKFQAEIQIQLQMIFNLQKKSCNLNCQIYYWKKTQFQNNKLFQRHIQRKLNYFLSLYNYLKDLLQIILIIRKGYLNSLNQVNKFFFHTFHFKEQTPLSGRELELDAIQELQKVQQFLYDIYCELPFIKNCYRWLVDRTFGTPEMLKIELSNYFRTQEYQLKSYDGCIIDWYFLLIFFTLNSLLLYASDGENLGPTVLFCQPNAGYYEYMMYESEWIDFYTRKNINMFLWNYRGYGESKGFPNTNALLKDGEFLVDFINDTLKAQTLLLHGESLGGMVACHLGKTKKAQFLFADRTFSSISSIATVGISKVARFMFNLITSWNYDSADAYIQCPYYKVLAMDPRDKIIPYLSSLKVEVGKQVLVKEFQFQHDDQVFLQLLKITFFIFENKQQLQFKFTQPYIEKWRWKCQLMFGKQKDIYSEVWNQHMMSKQDMTIFFEAIKRFIIQNKLKIRVQNIMVELSMKKKKMEESLALETNKSISDAPEGVIMSDTRDRDTNLTMDEEVSSSSNQQIKFSYQLSDQDKNSQKLYNFINSVFDIFESIEAAGISLNDIFTQQEEQYQQQIFADFLLSLFFWGSYLPIKHIYQKKLSTLLCQKLGFSKFSASLTKLDNFIKTEKQSCHMPIQIMVLNDLELIAIKFRLLRENFKKAIKAKQQSQSGVFQIEMKEQRDEEASTSIKIKKFKFKKKEFGQKLMEPVNRLLGNFFPLTCGHNGILEQQESIVLEFHMHQAGIQF